LSGREAGQWALRCASCRGNAGGRAKVDGGFPEDDGASRRSRDERTIGARDQQRGREIWGWRFIDSRGCPVPNNILATTRGGPRPGIRRRSWFFSHSKYSVFDVVLLFCNSSRCLHPSTAGETSSARSRTCTRDMSRAVSDDPLACAGSLWPHTLLNALRDPHCTNSVALLVETLP
jgi:hypothetical protein